MKPQSHLGATSRILRKRRTKGIVPASCEHHGGGKWDYMMANLPKGCLVRSRFNGAVDSELQEHYLAKVVDHWPPLKNNHASSSKKPRNNYVAIRYTSEVQNEIANLLKRRRKKPTDVFYVQPNDIQQCRIRMRSSMIKGSHVAPGSLLSARYVFNGKRVKGWDGFYPAKIIEHCVDGTFLVRYVNEKPIHGILTYKDIEIPVTD